MGRKQRDNTRKKISKSMKGKQNSLGHNQTDEHKMKVSKALRGKQNSLGYKHTDKTKLLDQWNLLWGRNIKF